MAEVTFGTSPAGYRHILGDLVARFFEVSGASGSTLHTGLQQILFVENQPFCKAGTASLITGLTESAGVLTLTTGGGAMVNEVIMAIGREG